MMKKIFLMVFLLLFYQWCVASICVNTSVDNALNIDAPFQGYSLAFSDSHFTDFRTFSSDNNAKFAFQIKKLAPVCPVILGLITSRECLIAGPILKKNKIVGLSPICGHNDINKYYPYLFSGTQPISKAAITIVNYLNH